MHRFHFLYPFEFIQVGLLSQITWKETDSNGRFVQITLSNTITQKRCRTARWRNNYQRTGIIHFIDTIQGVANKVFLFFFFFYTVSFLNLYLVARETNRNEWLTATSPMAKVKCSSTKNVTTEGWLQKDRLRGSSWKVPPWLSLQLSAAPPSSGMYDSAPVSVGLEASARSLNIPQRPGVSPTSVPGQIVPEVGSVQGEGLQVARLSGR